MDHLFQKHGWSVVKRDQNAEFDGLGEQMLALGLEFVLRIGGEELPGNFAGAKAELV